MKLRLRHNSVRLRLTRGEVDQLIATGLVEEIVEFPPNPLVYVLHASHETTEIGASFVNGWITVSVPEEMAQSWAEGDQTGMESVFRGISIAIEKDWNCLHPGSGKNEEDTDTFPHPQ